MTHFYVMNSTNYQKIECNTRTEAREMADYLTADSYVPGKPVVLWYVVIVPEESLEHFLSDDYRPLGVA